jgi:hypothetical protein
MNEQKNKIVIYDESSLRIARLLTMALVVLAIVLLSTISAHSQTAKVIQLSASDAAQAKYLHDQAVAALKRESEFTESLREKYLKATTSDEGQNHTQTRGYAFATESSPAHEGYWIKYGWGDGSFEYSEDFKFIVPIVKPYTQPSNGTIFGNTCITPAFTTLSVTGR